MSRHLVGHITVPVFELGERKFTGLRQNMLDAGPHNVSTGAGLGNDGIYAELDTDGKTVYRWIHGRDVLAAVAALVKHPDHDRLPRTEELDERPFHDLRDGET